MLTTFENAVYCIKIEKFLSNSKLVALSSCQQKKKNSPRGLEGIGDSKTVQKFKYLKCILKVDVKCAIHKLIFESKAKY